MPALSRTRPLVLMICAALMLGACVPVRAPDTGEETPVPAVGQVGDAAPVSWAQLTGRPAPPAGIRVPYGPDPLQFGELRLPEGEGRHPLAVVIHGGCWRAEYDLEHIAHLAEGLAQAGVATWAVEYRRVGDPGGGWPGTFADVIRAVEHVPTLAQIYPLDPQRVALVGHSAGAHLALWLAGRHNLPDGHALRASRPLPVRGVVSLAGITDLASYGDGERGCNAAVALLLGGSAAELPDRYAAASPASLLPLRVPQHLLHGDADPIVPLAQSEAFAADSAARGDQARVEVVRDAGHFDLVAPFSPAWPRVEAAVRSLLSVN